jgi:hypothetical protein
MVLVCKPACSSNIVQTSAQTSANGSTRVRQSCARANSLGNLSCRRYLRAVLSSMSVLIAATLSALPTVNSRRNLRTCLSVTIASLHA